jgi:hypothetical protein
MTRSAFDGLRGLAVSGVASAHDLADGLRRVAATEREFFEDLWAEGRAIHDLRKRRRAAQARVRTGAVGNDADEAADLDRDTVPEVGDVDAADDAEELAPVNLHG